MKKLAVVKDVPVEITALSPYVGRNTLEVPSNTTFTQWKQLGLTLNLYGSSSKWWYGDWVIAGEHLFKDKAIQEAAEILQIDPGTMATVVSVCKRFPPKSRTHKVGFELYREVWPLKEGEWEGWLIKAEQDNWSRSELRSHLKGHGLRREYKKDENAPRALEKAKGTIVELLTAFKGHMAEAMNRIPPVVNFCVSLANSDDWSKADMIGLDTLIDDARFALLQLQEDTRAILDLK